MLWSSWSWQHIVRFMVTRISPEILVCTGVFIPMESLIPHKRCTSINWFNTSESQNIKSWSEICSLSEKMLNWQCHILTVSCKNWGTILLYRKIKFPPSPPHGWEAVLYILLRGCAVHSVERLCCTFCWEAVLYVLLRGCAVHSVERLCCMFCTVSAIGHPHSLKN